jgi:hypothetical protein
MRGETYATQCAFEYQAFGKRLDVMTQNCCSSVRLSPVVQSAGEYPIVTGLESGMLSPRNQRRGELRMHRNWLLRGFCLAAAFDSADNRSDDIQLPMFEINVPPLQAEEFALSQPGRCSQQNQSALTKW